LGFNFSFQKLYIKKSEKNEWSKNDNGDDP